MVDGVVFPWTGPPAVESTGGLLGWNKKALELPEIVPTGREYR